MTCLGYTTNSPNLSLLGDSRSYLPGFWKAMPTNELVEHCRMGGRDAFDAFKARYRDPMYGMAYRMTGNHNDAEDLTQEGFLRIYRSFGAFNEATTLHAWIYRILRNAFIDQYRRECQSPFVSLEGAVEVGGDGVLLATESFSPSPHAYAEQNERKAIVFRAIDELPGLWRKPIILFYCEDRTYEEVGEILHIPLGTVRSRLFRGRLALKKLLAAERNALTD